MTEANSSAQNRFYFTYGTDERYPFRGGWTIVVAQDRTQAVKAFRLVHPDLNEGIVNCADIYDEAEFAATGMATDGNMGYYAHEHIEFTCGLTRQTKLTGKDTAPNYHEHTCCMMSGFPVRNGTPVYAVVLAKPAYEEGTAWMPMTDLVPCRYSTQSNAVLFRDDDDAPLPAGGIAPNAVAAWQQRMDKGSFIDPRTGEDCPNRDVLRAAYQGALSFLAPGPDGRYQCALAVLDRTIVDHLLQFAPNPGNPAICRLSELFLRLSRLWAPSPVLHDDPDILLMRKVANVVADRANELF